ncbi:hypothetical protein BHE74_00057698 [Ensete ventricosum]|nr:hypothetical protein BHE74_00057698 [Ensete ventricosum]
MGAGLKKDLRVSRVGPGGSLNAFCFLPIGVISQGLVMVRERGEQATLELFVCYTFPQHVGTYPLLFFLNLINFQLHLL